jgi:hypothetical protein
MKRFNLMKLNEVEGKEKYQVKVSNRFTALENLHDEFKTWLVEVEIRAKCGIYQRTEIGMAKPPKFDRSTSLAVFGCQFKTLAEHSCWTPQETAAYLINVLQSLASDVLHRVPKGAAV